MPITIAASLIQSCLNMPGSQMLHAYSTLIRLPPKPHQLIHQPQWLLVIGPVMPPRIVNSRLLSLSLHLVLYLIGQLPRHNILTVNRA